VIELERKLLDDPCTIILIFSFNVQNGTEPMDVLSDILRSIHFRRRKYARLGPVAPWCLRFPEADGFSLQIVEDGEAYLTISGEAHIHHLAAGDLVLLTKGQAHFIGSDLSLPPEIFDLASLKRLSAPAENDAIPNCRFIAGKFELSGDQHLMLRQLPAVVHLTKSALESSGRLMPTLKSLIAEVEDARVGGEAVIERLSDIIFIELLRLAIDSAEGEASWLAGLRHPAIGRALRLLHADHARRWTVEDLARSVGQSRSSFAAGFTGTIGMPPMEYLRTLRMKQAKRLLSDPSTKMPDVAVAAGYENVAAFATAFRSEAGLSPAKYRKQAPSADRLDL
jgi:AraC family transcriptional regulator, activator of mtrCDE